MAKKIRIFQIAKDLNISHLDIITFLKKNDVEVSSHMAPINSDNYVKILKEFSKEKLQIDRLRKEKARKEVQEHNKEKIINESVESSVLSNKKPPLETSNAIEGMDILNTKESKEDNKSIIWHR